MSVKKILTVIGTRPNFIKVTQFKNIAKKYPQFDLKIVHTSQHYSDEMSKVFFEQFNLIPDFFLDIPKGLSAVEQFAQIMVELEKLIKQTFYPDLIMVVGDVNSTLAAALTANKLNIKLAHIESGLRSFDNSMPEEHNRVLTDKISNYHFITEPDAYKNLIEEGISPKNIFDVGNTMIDTLVAFSDKIMQSDIQERLQLNPKDFVLLTMHRPGNVDAIEGIKKCLSLVKKLSETITVVFPAHPRTLNNLKQFGLEKDFLSIKNLKITTPLGYFDFQNLIRHCSFIITDSGGIQEESAYLNIPCITLRPSTERPITMWQGSNILLPFDESIIFPYIQQIKAGTNKLTIGIKNWDGKATERVFDTLNNLLL